MKIFHYGAEKSTYDLTHRTIGTCLIIIKMITKVKLVLVVIVMAISMLFANLAMQLDIDLGAKITLLNTNPSDDTNIEMTNSSSHLMWFLQISDLHLSIFTDKSRIIEFEDFCTTTINAINPTAVLASGDLTDAKHKNKMGSGQFKEEWILYREILNRCNINSKTLWLDIRGNHDNFDVPGWESELNYFRNYSIQGSQNPRSYMHIVKHGDEKYAFIGLDACLEPGPRRPINFIGILTKDEVNNVKLFLKRAEAENVDHIVWFGHYPSSCIVSFHEESVRDIIGNVKTSRAYLCGHLHQIGGLVTEMYTLQRQGYLELELGDWKDNRMFRLAAIDHGLFSFVDYQHDVWPVTLITNPKHALYAMPSREPLKITSQSTHIRLITFSISAIELVQVKIDNGRWKSCIHVDGPLYTAKWDPSLYTAGIHKIYAKVKDVQGRERITEQPFSLDGSRMSFKLLAKTALMLDASTIFQCMFGSMILICILPLTYLRYKHHRILIGKSPPWKFQKKSHTWFRRLWLLSTVDSLFYPLVLYELYLCFGPWCVGEIMGGHIGIVFAWGVIVNKAYIPGSFTYIYGFLQVFICQFPMMLILAKCVDNRFLLHWAGVNTQKSLFKSILSHLPFILVLSVQMVLAYFFLLAYGPLAFLIGPLRTWSILLNIYLWYKAVTLSSRSTREAAYVWMLNNMHTRKSAVEEASRE